MKTLTHDKTARSHFRAYLATCLRWLKIDGKDVASRTIRQEWLLFMLAIMAFFCMLLLNVAIPTPKEPLAAAFVEGMDVWLTGFSILLFAGGMAYQIFKTVWLQWTEGTTMLLAPRILQLFRNIALLNACGYFFVGLARTIGDDIVQAGPKGYAALLAIIPVLLLFTVFAAWRSGSAPSVVIHVHHGNVLPKTPADDDAKRSRCC